VDVAQANSGKEGDDLVGRVAAALVPGDDVRDSDPVPGDARPPTTDAGRLGDMFGTDSHDGRPPTRNCTMPTTRVALGGCGKVAQVHVAALRTLPEIELVAACDALPDRANAFAGTHGIQPFTDVPTMLREAKPHAVIVGTPHPRHAEPTVQAAEAGVHVLVEK